MICDNSRPLQKDSFNCGVYVMYYLNCVIHGTPYDKSFNPAKYRTSIAETLLISSECMNEVCQYCFSDRNCH